MISVDSAQPGSDQVVGAKEIFFILRAQGLSSVTESEVLDIVSECDSSGLGEVNFEEFCNFFAKMLPAEREPGQEISDAFEAIGDGKSVSHDNLKEAIVSLGIGVQDEEVREMIEEADIDLRGKISREDFKLMMSNRHKDTIET